MAITRRNMAVFILSVLGIDSMQAQLTAPSEEVPKAISCKDTGWVGFQDHCYFHSKNNDDSFALETYLKASAACRREGGYLVSIHSKEEEEFVYSLTDGDNDVWIGSVNEGHKDMAWKDKMHLSHSKFISADSASSKSCIFITSSRRRLWISDSCEELRSYICKKVRENETRLPDKRCKKCQPRRSKRSSLRPHSELQNQDHEGSRISFASDSHPFRSYFHSRFSNPFTQRHNGYDLTPDDYDLLGRHGIHNHLKKLDIFNNLNHRDILDFQKIVHSYLRTPPPLSISALDKLPIHRLGSNPKDKKPEVERSTEASTGSVSLFRLITASLDETSTGTSYFTGPKVAEGLTPRTTIKPTFINSPTTATQGSVCRKGDAFHNGSCYIKPDPEDPQNFQNALSKCRDKGSSLVVIDNFAEQIFLSELLQNLNGEVWIGLTNNNSSERDQVTLQWVDGTLADESLDKYIFTGSYLSPGACMTVTKRLTEDGSWVLERCVENIFPYICEYNPTTQLPFGEGCLDGWEPVGGRCYKVFPKPASWNESEEHCSHFGAHLASVGNLEEEDVLKRLSQNSEVSEPFYSFWIGLEFTSESNYHWTDGSPTSYLNWAEGQPDSHQEKEHCASVTRTNFRLYDSPCDAFLPLICEAAEGTMLVTQQPPPKKPNSTCEDDPSWLLFNGHCYKIISREDDDPQTWWQSRRLCRDIGGELASIHSVEENYWLQSKVYNLEDNILWLGGSSYMDSGYDWVDNTPWDFTNWAKGEPNNIYDQEDCIAIYARNFGYWNDQNCGHKHGRVCKRPVGVTHPPPVTTPVPEGNCPGGWVHAGTKCLRFVTERVTFDDARKACRTLDHRADLVSVQSAKEQAYLTAALGDVRMNLWIGLRYEDGFHWLDQSALTYTNWAQGEPSSSGWLDHEQSENCVDTHIYNLAGQWNNMYCNTLRGYVCQTKLDPSIPESDSFLSCAAPFENYFNYSGMCYRPETNAKTWEEAERICKSEGGHLASTVSRAESAWLWVLTQRHGIYDPWIGFNNKRDAKVFEWSDSWPTIYTNWAQQNPNVSLSNHNCVKLGSDDGFWYTDNCTQARPFICKHNDEPFPTPDPSIGGSCPDERWIDFGGSFCYLLVTSVSPWNDANYRCAEEGSSLASIHSKAEMDLIIQAAHNIHDPMWIGLVQMKNGFGWIDETGYDFINWQEGEPNHGKEECTEIYPGTGLWNDAFCSNARPFICKTLKRNNGNVDDLGVPAELTGDSPSAGTIAGIVIPLVLLVFGGLAFLAYYYTKKPKPIGSSGSFGFDNALYSTAENPNVEINPSFPTNEEEEEEDDDDEYGDGEL